MQQLVYLNIIFEISDKYKPVCVTRAFVGAFWDQLKTKKDVISELLECVVIKTAELYKSCHENKKREINKKKTIKKTHTQQQLI